LKAVAQVGGRSAVEAARAGTMTALQPVERTLLRRAGEPSHPPCFVIGPPRSGTTLLYELLVTRFRFAYVSNLAHRLYRVPVAASWLGRTWTMRWRGRFESRYGHIEGMGAPNEGGRLWSRWMPGMDPMGPDQVARLPASDIRATVAGLEKCFGGPFLNKNVVFSVRMRLLDAIFPGCLFVEVTRDVRANIRSILRAERSEGGPRDATGWWSVKPREWHEHRNLSPAWRATAQVRYVHADIAEDAAALGTDRVLGVSYEEMCRRPRKTIDRVGEFLRGGGAPVAVRGGLPESFPPTTASPLEDETESEIERALASLGQADDGLAERREDD